MITDDVKSYITQGSQLIKTAWGNISQFIRQNPITAGSIGAVGVLGTLGASQIVGKIKKRKSKKKKRTKKAIRHRKHKRRRKKRYSHKKQRKPYTAHKRRDTSHRRIRFTKNNQPYIILRSGKARFIKKSSVRRRRKMKGGFY